MKLVFLAVTIFATSAGTAQARLTRAACVPSKENRERTTDTIITQCSKRGYGCAIADLNQDGELASGGELSFETLSAGYCYVMNEPHKYGAGVASCKLCLGNDGQEAITISAGITDIGASYTVYAGEEHCIERRYNCAVWCGPDKYENNENIWNLNTFRRCYGQSTCSKSNCLENQAWFGNDYWY